MNLYLAVLLLYSAVLIAAGLLVGRRVRSASDYLVAGRSLGPGRIFATFLAANIGAGSTVGATGLGYRFGLSAWWWVGSAAIGTLILAHTLGPRLWAYAHRHHLATLGDFLELRFGRPVKAILSGLFWCGALALLAAQLIAIASILATVAGISKWQGCLIGGIVAIVYCTAGGLISSTAVNIFELAVTMSGLLLAVPFALHAVGGWHHLHTVIAAQTPGAARLFSLTGAGPTQILAWFAILVPSFIVSPGLVQKLYAARDARTVRLGISINSIAQAIFAFVPAILGLCALATLPHLANPELALPAAMKILLPRWLGVWTLASIFSAELSATGAILFMLSTSLSVDLYKTFLRPHISPAELLTASRAASVAAGAAGLLVAILLPSIIAAVSIFYSLLAVALFVPVVAGLYSRRTLPSAAIASIVTALSVTILLSRFTHDHGLADLSPSALGIAAAGAVMLIFRLLRPAPPSNTPVIASGTGSR